MTMLRRTISRVLLIELVVIEYSEIPAESHAAYASMQQLRIVPNPNKIVSNIGHYSRQQTQKEVRQVSHEVCHG